MEIHNPVLRHIVACVRRFAGRNRVGATSAGKGKPVARERSEMPDVITKLERCKRIAKIQQDKSFPGNLAGFGITREDSKILALRLEKIGWPSFAANNYEQNLNS